MTEIGKAVLASITAASLLGALTTLPSTSFVTPAAALDAGSKDASKRKAKPTPSTSKPKVKSKSKSSGHAQ
jgi:hypothetical protein